MKKLLEFDEIDSLAEHLAKITKTGDLIALVGDLGTGKTTFVKRFAKAIGIKEEVRSPTFTLVQEYSSGEKELYHFDVYRISNSEEIYDTGFEDYLKRDGIIIIEWANLIEKELPEGYIKISIEHYDEYRRLVEITYHGDYKKEEEILNYVGFRN